MAARKHAERLAPLLVRRLQPHAAMGNLESTAVNALIARLQARPLPSTTDESMFARGTPTPRVRMVTAPPLAPIPAIARPVSERDRYLAMLKQLALPMIALVALGALIAGIVLVRHRAPAAPAAAIAPIVTPIAPPPTVTPIELPAPAPVAVAEAPVDADVIASADLAADPAPVATHHHKRRAAKRHHKQH